MPVKRGELEPLVQTGEALLGPCRQACDQILQHRGMAGSQAPPLRRQPVVEERAAADLQPFEKISDEQRRQRAQPLQVRLVDALLHRQADLDDIDVAIAEVQPHHVLRRLYPAAVGLVEQGSGLAEAPAQLAARIVRNVPQQLAKMRAHDGMRGKRQIGNERAQLAGRRQRQCGAGPADRHGSEHPHLDGALGDGTARPYAARPVAARPVMARPIRFHSGFHAGYHARLHGRFLSLTSRSTARAYLHGAGCDSSICGRQSPPHAHRTNGDRPCPLPPSPPVQCVIPHSPTWPP
ncbi:hypothetical protein D3C72_1211290 [compost metagenome]